MNLSTRIEKLEQKKGKEQQHADTSQEASRPYRPGPWPGDCICFPHEPLFFDPDDIPVAAAVQCPLHRERFNTYRFPLVYVAKWRREQVVLEQNPNGKQYEKAWRAAFPLGYYDRTCAPRTQREFEKWLKLYETHSIREFEEVTNE